MSMTQRLRPISMAIAVLLAGAAAAAQGGRSMVAPPPGDLAAAASAYASDFVKHFAGVVAEERYSQRAQLPNWVIPRTRQLVSDALLVQLPDGDYAFFRDVFSQDGRDVRDRDDRLAKLLLTPSPSAVQQAEALAAESSRRSLVDIGVRDNPLTAIAMLQPSYIVRFRARAGGRDRAVGDNVWVVVFEETTRPTILHESRNAELNDPSEVRAWIDADSRRVVRTELRRAGALSGTQTDFEWDDTLGFAVPVRMTHQFGQAIYDRFRRFQVKTDERLGADGTGR